MRESTISENESSEMWKLRRKKCKKKGHFEIKKDEPLKTGHLQKAIKNENQMLREREILEDC